MVIGVGGVAQHRPFGLPCRTVQSLGSDRGVSRKGSNQRRVIALGTIDGRNWVIVTDRLLSFFKLISLFTQ